jgi:hypothetical protein
LFGRNGTILMKQSKNGPKFVVSDDETSETRMTPSGLKTERPKK